MIKINGYLLVAASVTFLISFLLLFSSYLVEVETLTAYRSQLKQTALISFGAALVVLIVTCRQIHNALHDPNIDPLIKAALFYRG